MTLFDSSLLITSLWPRKAWTRGSDRRESDGHSPFPRRAHLGQGTQNALLSLGLDMMCQRFIGLSVINGTAS